MNTTIKNRFVVPIVIYLLILSLAGCSGGSYKTLVASESNTNNSMEMSYKDFEGYRYTSVKLNKDDELSFNINVTTQEGNLKISLLDENNTELFAVENPKEQISKTIKITKDGTYRVNVEGKHSGSYKITWDIKKA